jgi:hypothetical protein
MYNNQVDLNGWQVQERITRSYRLNFVPTMALMNELNTRPPTVVMFELQFPEEMGAKDVLVTVNDVAGFKDAEKMLENVEKEVAFIKDIERKRAWSK